LSLQIHSSESQIKTIMPAREDIFQKAMNEGHSAAWDQEWGKAVTAYRHALQEMPDNPKALNSLGLALYSLGNVEEAFQIYMRVAKITPDDPVPMEKVAQLSERLGDLKTAMDAAIRAGDLFLKQRDTEKAVENWVRVTNINPENAIAHSRLAQVHEKLGTCATGSYRISRHRQHHPARRQHGKNTGDGEQSPITPAKQP
jgi:Flp pilus assembly protein TadD